MKAVLFAVGWLFIIMFGLPLVLVIFGYSLSDAWWVYALGLLVGVGLLVWRRQLTAKEDMLYHAVSKLSSSPTISAEPPLDGTVLGSLYPDDYPEQAYCLTCGYPVRGRVLIQQSHGSHTVKPTFSPE